MRPLRRRLLSEGIAASLLYLALVAVLFQPLLGCLGDCFTGVEWRFGSPLALADTRLNAWSLAWVQHALLAQPLDLFHANAFHPAENGLAGSEHLIGLALLTLPLRIAVDDAVLVYQATLLLSSWILSMTSYALLRWLTGSLWIALVCGALALYMPWRTEVAGHIQLLGAHWFPLI